MQPLKSRVFLALLMQPLSAKELFTFLRKEGFNCTYSAVYKTIQELQKEQAINKIGEKYSANDSWIQSNLKLLRTAQSCSFSFTENFTVNSSKVFFDVLKSFMKNSKRKVFRFSFIPPEFFSDLDFFQNSDIQLPQESETEKLFANSILQEKPKQRNRQSLDFFINDTSILYLFNSSTFLKSLDKDYFKSIRKRNSFLLKHEKLEESPIHSNDNEVLSQFAKSEI